MLLNWWKIIKDYFVGENEFEVECSFIHGHPRYYTITRRSTSRWDSGRQDIASGLNRFEAITTCLKLRKHYYGRFYNKRIAC